MDNPQPKPDHVEQVIRDDGRYHFAAFSFLQESLTRAAEYVHGEPGGGHVTGRQLSDAFRELAIQRWGMMAPAVLRRWGINASIDVGNMVYLLIDEGLMRRTDEDSVEDFCDCFDLGKDFDTSLDIRMRL